MRRGKGFWGSLWNGIKSGVKGVADIAGPIASIVKHAGAGRRKKRHHHRGGGRPKVINM